MAKETTEAFYELDETTEELFMDVFNKKSFPVNVNFQFIGSSKQKRSRRGRTDSSGETRHRAAASLQAEAL